MASNGTTDLLSGEVPIKDAVGGFHKKRGSTQIEGMEALAISAPEENLTEAERSMRDEEISFYSASDNEYGDDNIWGLLSGVGGNVHEW
jgi:hypothetical protein